MTNTKQSSNNLLLALFLIIAFAAGIFGFRFYNLSKMNNLKNKVLPGIVKKAINNDQIKFTIGAIKETSGVYEFELTINNQKITSYITKDGKLMFPQVFKTSGPGTTNTTSETKKLSCNDLTKTKSPVLTAFVVSQCPYGIQMQRLIKTVFSEQPALQKNINIKYIGAIENGKITAMRGDAEAQENLRQICIREEQKDKYWPYVSCYMQAGKTDDCLSQAKVDTAKLSGCVTDNNRGLKFAQKDFDLANKLQVGGSPTLILNEKQTVSEFDFGGRVANSLKEIICCASEKKPDFCSKELSKKEIAISFSETDEAVAGSSTQNANCGN